jgi:hypothetical protein
MPPRISLATLIGIVAVLALALAGMLSASRLWLMLASTVVLALLLTSILAAWLFSGIDRAFWVGFALFGWTYLILVNWGWIGGQIGSELTIGFSEAAEWVLPEVKAPPLQFGVPAPASPLSATSPAQIGTTVPAPPAFVNPANYMELARQRQIRIGNFVQIGRILGALIFAVLGGWIGRALAERAESSKRAARPAAPG